MKTLHVNLYKLIQQQNNSLGGCYENSSIRKFIYYIRINIRSRPNSFSWSPSWEQVL